MRTFLIVLLIFSSVITIAQSNKEYAAIDSKAIRIPDSLSKSVNTIAEYINTVISLNIFTSIVPRVNKKYLECH